MARIKGNGSANALSGTRRNDLIRGLGGDDTLEGNAGNDTLIGLGEVRGDAGNDRFFAVNLFALHDPASFSGAFTEVDLGAGKDRAFVSDHEGTTEFGAIALDITVDTGAGADRAVIASTRFETRVELGDGRDKALVLTENAAQISLGDNGFGRGDDGDKDVVRVAAEGADVTIFDFGRNDKLEIFGTNLSFAQVQNRTNFTFGTDLTVTITLPTGREITVFKQFEGDMRKANLSTTNKDLTVREKVHVGDDRQKTDAVFGSGADDVIKAGKKTLFLGGGDDRGNGSGRADVMHGEGGDDRLIGRGKSDQLFGGLGDDFLDGGGGADRLRAGQGDDTVKGGAGKDRIEIDGGETSVRGNAGADVIRFAADGFFDAGHETDIRRGGGRDRVVLNGMDRGTVLIRDFVSGEDKLDLRGSFGTNGDRRAVFEDLGPARDEPGYSGPNGVFVDLGDGTPLDLVLVGLRVDDLSLRDFIG